MDNGSFISISIYIIISVTPTAVFKHPASRSSNLLQLLLTSQVAQFSPRINRCQDITVSVLKYQMNSIRVKCKGLCTPLNDSYLYSICGFYFVHLENGSFLASLPQSSIYCIYQYNILVCCTYIFFYFSV